MSDQNPDWGITHRLCPERNRHLGTTDYACMLLYGKQDDYACREDHCPMRLTPEQSPPVRVCDEDDGYPD